MLESPLGAFNSGRGQGRHLFSNFVELNEVNAYAKFTILLRYIHYKGTPGTVATSDYSFLSHLLELFMDMFGIVKWDRTWGYLH